MDLQNRMSKVTISHEYGAGVPCLKCKDKCEGFDLHYWRKICRNCKCGPEEHDLPLGEFQQRKVGRLLDSVPNLSIAGRIESCLQQQQAVLPGSSTSNRALSINARPPISGADSPSSAPVNHTSKRVPGTATASSTVSISNSSTQTQPLPFEWVPSGIAKHMAARYMELLPSNKRPTPGTDGAHYRRRQLARQLPAHDEDPSHCHELSPAEVKRMESFVIEYKAKALGIASVCQVGASNWAGEPPDGSKGELQSEVSVGIDTGVGDSGKVKVPGTEGQEIGVVEGHAGQNHGQRVSTSLFVQLGKKQRGEEVRPNAIKTPENVKKAAAGVGTKEVPETSSKLAGNIKAGLGQGRLGIDIPSQGSANSLHREEDSKRYKDDNNVSLKEEKGHLARTSYGFDTKKHEAGSLLKTDGENVKVAGQSPMTGMGATKIQGKIAGSAVMPGECFVAQQDQSTGRNQDTQATMAASDWKKRPQTEISQTVDSGSDPVRKTAGGIHIGDNGIGKKAETLVEAGKGNAFESVKEIKQPSSKALEEPYLHQEYSCKKCKEQLQPGELAVFAERAGPNSLWHPACFVCSRCTELLVDLIYFWKGGKLYCGRHYGESELSRCAGCDELIFSKKYTKAEDQFWHLKHFCCFECDCVLADSSYVMENSKPVCVPCYTKKYAQCCQACQNAIAPDAQHVSFGNFSWHASPSCFRCSGCGCSLCGERFLPHQTMLFCSVTCEHRL
uniref:Testis derived transcript (3 LIM domains) n=1 Tax=Eptatretus burgeri TaxID=7764 RepID=A0A8C4NG10_EPTBU